MGRKIYEYKGWAALGLLTLAAACGDEEPAGGGGRDGGSDGGPAEDGGGEGDGGGENVVPASNQHGIDAVDLLFVIDNSASMAQEQAALAAQLPRLVRILASGDLEDGQPDADGEVGVPDFPPVKDMHIGVVSTNMGAPVDLVGESLPASAASCASPGDDGRLLFPSSCGGRAPSGNFLEFQATGGNADVEVVQALGNDVACLAQLGIDGCGYEQQLDAMLKALVSSPEYTFYGGATGNGDDANEGFLRDDAVLAVVVVTDEEDCSIPDANAALVSFASSGQVELTNTATGAQDIPVDLATPLNLRCGTYPNAQHPIERYTNGLRGLKPLNPELVVFAAIAGIPVELEGMRTEAILSNPPMQFRSNMPADPLNPQAQAEPSCTFPNPGFDSSRPEDPSTNPRTQNAYPPRRIVALAGQFGENGIVRSICQDDYTGAIDTLISKVSDQLSR